MAQLFLEAKEALRIMPNCSEAYRLLGKAYLDKGQHQEALVSLRTALLLSPNNLEALVNLGICLRELKEPEAAIKALKGTIRLNNTYATAYSS